MTGEITVIVPTLWAAPSFDDVVMKLADVIAVGEVIVVDNNPDAGKTLSHPKIRLLRQRRNIFVNPAWNLGAREAQGSILCFLNDDLAPKSEAFEFCLRVLQSDPSVGLVGLKWGQQLAVKLQLHELERPDSPAFGCMMFMRACDYRRIPGMLKIWHGDDFLFAVTRYRGFRVLALSGFADAAQPRSISTNSISKEVSGIILQRDAIRWNRWVKRLLLMRYRPMDAVLSAFVRIGSELGKFARKVRGL